MSTIEQYELHETVRALELAALQLEILTHRDELDGEEINERFSWQDHANCREADQDLSFSRRGSLTRKARAMCAACIVKKECLEFALTKGERFGIWGGLSERQRRKIHGQRARAAKRA